MQTLEPIKPLAVDGPDLDERQQISRINPQSISEPDLLSEHLSGDRQAFTEIVEKYERTFQRYFYRQSRDRQLAEDLTQDLFLKVAHLSGRYEAQGHLETFLFQVARNLWIDRYRQQVSRPQVHHFGCSEDEETSEVERKSDERAGPLEAASLQDQVQKLRRAVGRLDQKHREVVELDLIDQLEQSEIAAELGIPVGTVKSRKFNAIDRLAVLYQKLRQ